MKKNWLLYVLVIACLCSVFTSCGKDDDPDPEPPVIVDLPVAPTWKDALGTYKAEGSLKLNLNAAPLINVSQKTVTLAAGTGENAKLTLVNILPDDASVEVNNVVVTKKADSEDFLFTWEATVGATLISVSGTLTGITGETKTFELKTTRKINLPTAGVWKLKIGQEGADVRFVTQTGSIEQDMMFFALGPVFGGMLAQKVTDVSVLLQENGDFDLNWTIAGEETPTGIPDAVKNMGVSIPYYFDAEYNLYLALDTSLLNVLAQLPQLEGINLQALLPSLIQAGIVVSKGGFIAVSLNMQASEENVGEGLFYVKKETLGVILPLLAPLLSGMVEGLPPAVAGQIGAVLQNLPEIVAAAERFDVGLGFVKQ